MSLRGKIIRLAYEKQELREKLLPLVKKSRLIQPEVSGRVIGEAMRKVRFQERNDAKGAVELAFTDYNQPLEVIIPPSTEGGCDYNQGIRESADEEPSGVSSAKPPLLDKGSGDRVGNTKDEPTMTISGFHHRWNDYRHPYKYRSLVRVGF